MGIGEEGKNLMRVGLSCNERGPLHSSLTL